MDAHSELPGQMLGTLLRARRKAIREIEDRGAACPSHRKETAAEARRWAERITDRRMYQGFTGEEMDQMAAFQARMLANLRESLTINDT